MIEKEIKNELKGLPKAKRDLSRIGMELCYFDHQDMEYIRDEHTTLFDVEKLLTTKRLAQPLT